MTAVLACSTERFSPPLLPIRRLQHLEVLTFALDAAHTEVRVATLVVPVVEYFAFSSAPLWMCTLLELLAGAR